MKKYLFSILALVTLAFTSCNSADDPVEAVNNSNKGFTFSAVLPQQPASTRLVAEDDGTYVNFTWGTNGDRDNVRFHYENADNANNWFGENRLPTISGSLATFSLTHTPKADSYVYGCNNGNALSKYNDATSALFLIDPRNMIYKDLYDLGKYNPMIGVIQKSDKSIPNTMYFKNICALLKFTITLPVNDNITNITINNYVGGAKKNFTYGRWAVKCNSDGTFGYYGNQNEKPVDGTTPNSASSLWVNNNWTTTSGTITFYAVILPQDISGFYLDVIAGGTTYSKFTSVSKTLEAGKMYTINLTNSSNWSTGS